MNESLNWQSSMNNHQGHELLYFSSSTGLSFVDDGLALFECRKSLSDVVASGIMTLTGRLLAKVNFKLIERSFWVTELSVPSRLCLHFSYLRKSK